MMLKTTLILFILSVITKIITKVLIENMTPLEKAACNLKKDYLPRRVMIASLTWFLITFAAIVCLIITIVQW